MPLKKCSANGRPGYKWGDSGKCYTYSPGDKVGMGKAKQKAHIQGSTYEQNQKPSYISHNIADQLRNKGYWGTRDFEEHNKVFEMDKKEATAAQQKPGGSNAGNYSTKGPFCGPSGGAPAGTFPVNTKKRAIAALAYARNAPNPGGIRSCVARHWPDLPSSKKK